VDGAKPGIVMKANPQVGAPYRQELYLGEADDVAQFIALNQTVSVAAGTFGGCVQSKDFSPLEPDPIEHKYLTRRGGGRPPPHRPPGGVLPLLGAR
jgi:hypothetical protein